ncbi:hypothetical protein I7I48_08324 [Histoplasma ohiense]|nr:hypothetical protein I7I48_08324 [Histoplasma ohiense (nom. inval.)]
MPKVPLCIGAIWPRFIHDVQRPLCPDSVRCQLNKPAHMMHGATYGLAPSSTQQEKGKIKEDQSGEKRDGSKQACIKREHGPALVPVAVAVSSRPRFIPLDC